MSNEKKKPKRPSAETLKRLDRRLAEHLKIRDDSGDPNYWDKEMVKSQFKEWKEHKKKKKKKNDLKINKN